MKKSGRRRAAIACCMESGFKSNEECNELYKKLYRHEEKQKGCLMQFESNVPLMLKLSERWSRL